MRGGLGVGLLPAWLVADELRLGALVECVGDAPSMNAPVSLVRAAGSTLPRRARLVFDAVAAELSKAFGKKSTH